MNVPLAFSFPPAFYHLFPPSLLPVAHDQAFYTEAHGRAHSGRTTALGGALSDSSGALTHSPFLSLVILPEEYDTKERAMMALSQNGTLSPCASFSPHDIMLLDN